MPPEPTRPARRSRPRWARWWRLGVLCCLLGALTTGAVGWVLLLNFPTPLTEASFYRSPSPWWFLRARSAAGGVVRYIWMNPDRSASQITALTNANVDAHELAGWSRLAYFHTSFWADFYPRKNPASRDTPAAAQLPSAIDRLTGSASAVVLDQCGWPLPALQSRIVFAIDARMAPGHTCNWGFELPPGPGAGGPTVGPSPAIAYSPPGLITGLRSLPLMPAWPGALVDTTVYAAVWGVLLITPRLIARALRKKPGACKRCGYDLAGLAPSGRCPECGTAA